MKFFTTPSRPALGTHCHTTHLHLVQKLRIRGATPPRPHMPSWRATVQINRFQTVSRTRPARSQLGTCGIKTSRNCVGLPSLNFYRPLSRFRYCFGKNHSSRSHSEVTSAARLPTWTAHSSAPLTPPSPTHTSVYGYTTGCHPPGLHFRPA